MYRMIDHFSHIRECKEELLRQRRLREDDLERYEDLAREKNMREEDLKRSRAQLKSLQNRYDKDINELRGRLEQETFQARQEREMLHEKYQLEFHQMVSRHEAEHTTLVRQHNEEKEMINDSYNIKIDQLLANHESSIAIKDNHAAELTDALLAKDNDAYLPATLGVAELLQYEDAQIKTKLVALVRLVDELARLEWQTQQQVWTEQILSGLDIHENPRLLKRSILQDSIWTTLHKYVFGSPFRMFGEEGKLLDNEWKTKHGQDSSSELEDENEVYSWPNPDIKTERWRYMTLRECRRILAEPVSAIDSRSRLKIGFKTNEMALIQELRSMLTDMVISDSNTVSTIEQLARKSLITWLEFGMHRCRIVFLGLPKAYSATEKAQRATAGTLRFTAIPGLAMYGKVDGLGLEVFKQLQGAQVA